MSRKPSRQTTSE